MKERLLSEVAGQRTYAAVFAAGDDVMTGLLALADREALSAASFTAIGAFQQVTLGYFDLERRDYDRIRLREQVEVLSLTGNIALSAGGRKVHAHVVVGRRDGTAHGGHLLEATVRPTLEVVVTESPVHLRRTSDPATGLALLDLDRS
jgi:predicted DNA-binding protein with PD1-like motif